MTMTNYAKFLILLMVVAVAVVNVKKEGLGFDLG